MTIVLTRPAKRVLEVNSPVMPAAGTFGYGERYRDLVNFDKLGAIVTNPITYEAWSPATGTRVVPLDAGVLMHTGLPNPGLNKALRRHRNLWTLLPVPVIVHLVATSVDHIRKCAARLDEEDSVAAIEIGLNDDITAHEAEALIDAAVSRTDKPILARLPLNDAYEIAESVVDAGAGALVISAPPRGTARDPQTGRLVSGRLYGPVVKPIILRVVGQLSRRIDIPIIGAGGIHTPQDARDYIEAGAVAVQVDSLTWIDPKSLEVVARDLGGMVVTRESGALPDEWHPGMGDTERDQRRKEAKTGRKDAETDDDAPTGH
jgi:dihydroorotate dehydrogenase (NAD+) catalytic subunit